MAFEKYGQGRCINCGFLGKKDVDDYGQECYIASSRDREDGNFSHHIILSKLSLDTVPWCFVGKANLKDEVDQLDWKIDRTTRTLSIITKDRHCPSWYVWREFSSPKEQWEESVMLAMEKRRQDFEIQMEKDRKEFELKLFEMNQQVQRDSQAIMRDSKTIVEHNDMFNRRITYFLIGLAVAEVVGTFLALAYPNGVDWLVRLVTPK